MEIAQSCEEYAEDLLELCENMEEVKILLQNQKVKLCKDLERTWKYAIWNSHKQFVSHHYYQEFISQKIYGQEYDNEYLWNDYYFIWRWLQASLFGVILF